MSPSAGVEGFVRVLTHKTISGKSRRIELAFPSCVEEAAKLAAETRY